METHQMHPENITQIEVGHHVKDTDTDIILEYVGIEMHEHIFVSADVRISVPKEDLPNFQDRFVFVDPPKEDEPDEPEKTDTTTSTPSPDISPDSLNSQEAPPDENNTKD